MEAAQEMDAGAQSASRESALRRVQKLLMLADSNASEAVSARRQANGLMERHGIDEATVRAAPELAHLEQVKERELTERPALEMQDKRTKHERPWEVYAGYDGLPGHREARFLAEWMPSAAHLLCTSSVQPLTLGELLASAGPDSQRRWEGLSFGGTDPRGSAALREEIASMYGAPTQEDVLVTCAEQEARYVAMRALLRKGDHVVLQWGAHEVAKQMGARVILWRPEEGPRGELRFCINMLRAIMGASSPALSPRLLLTSFPHDPTGWQPTPSEWGEVVDICRKHGSYLLSDETLRGTEYSDADLLQPAVDMYDLGISLGGVSQGLGLEGLRIAWVVLRGEALRHRMLGIKDYLSQAAAAPSEALAIMGLRAAPQIARRNREVALSNLGLLRAFMAEHADLFSWSEPRAGPVGLVNLLPGARMLRESSEGFCLRLVRTQGVLLLPDSVFGVEGGSRMRVGFGRRDFPRALQALRGAIRRLGPHLGPLAAVEAGAEEAEEGGKKELSAKNTLVQL